VRSESKPLAQRRQQLLSLIALGGQVGQQHMKLLHRLRLGRGSFHQDAGNGTMRLVRTRSAAATISGDIGRPFASPAGSDAGVCGCAAAAILGPPVAPPNRA